MKKKKVVVRRSKDSIKEVEPEKGKPTFSVVDNANPDTNKASNGSVDLEPLISRMENAIKAEKQVMVNIEESPKPPINVSVEPTPINLRPAINVEPTPIKVQVPTQRIPPAAAPIVNVENKTDTFHLLVLGYFLAFLLSGIFGALVWLLLTSLNLN